MFSNNVQPATTYDPAVGWTELDPSCDGCAVQGSCNYDPSASDDPAVNPQWQSSCITPTDCLLCDPAHTVGPTYPSNASLVQNPACDCATVIAHECNNEQNVRTVYCMTIDGDPNVQVNDAFILKYKVGPMAEGKTPLLTVVEQSKGPGMGIKNDPKGGDGLNLAIDDVVGPAEPYNAGAKTFVVMSVGMTNGPALPKDYDSADCVDRNYKCTMVGNSPGHSICMSTFDPLQAGVVFATKQQCIASGCHDAHWSIDLQVQHASDGQGQSEIEATQNLNEINKINDTNFLMSFSYGRALQQSALKNWAKDIKDTNSTQKIFNHRSKMNGLSTSAKWSIDLEKQITA